MATCETLRNMNLSRMREYMLLNRKVRVADAARDTGMSIPTAAKLIADLVECGEMKEVGCCASTGGRCAMVYEINPDYLSYLLLRCEFDQYRYQLCDYAGELLESGSFEAGENALEQLDHLISEIRLRYPNLRGVCMGISAFVSDNCVQRSLQKSPLLGLDMREHIENMLGVPFFMENDVNTVALACWKQSGLQKGCIVCLYRSGVGLVIDGRIWRGRNGLPGEISMFRPLKNANRWSQESDPSFYNAFTAGVYAVTLDPDRIVIYTPEGEAPCDPLAVHKLLEKQLASEYVPEIRVSDSWNADYWLGLDMQMRAHLGIS